VVPKDGGCFKQFFDDCINLFLVNRQVYEEAHAYFYGSASREIEFNIPGEDALRQIIDNAPEDFTNHFRGSFFVGYYGDLSIDGYAAHDIDELLDKIAREFDYPSIASLISHKEEWVKYLLDRMDEYENDDDGDYGEGNDMDADADEDADVMYRCVIEIPRRDISRPGYGDVLITLRWDFEDFSRYIGIPRQERRGGPVGWLMVRGALGELKCLDSLAGTCNGKAVNMQW
jgi:hypothetical protein